MILVDIQRGDFNMTALDRKTFFSSLGFLAILFKGQEDDKSAASKAGIMAGLIEAFCEETISAPSPEKAPVRVIWLLDQIIRSLKAQLKAGQPVELPSNKELKIEILHSLQERQGLYATEALRGEQLLNTSIENLLQAEIKNVKSEAQMMIAHVQGDPNAFAPYQYLATAIANIIRKKGECTKDDVKRMGFSSEELDRWNMAYALAQVDLMGE